MSIPLIANLGFTEVSSAGNLNDKAGTDKSKLPVQLFKLTDNISGNLTMTNDSAPLIPKKELSKDSIKSVDMKAVYFVFCNT